jgi:hypothetical protein
MTDLCFWNQAVTRGPPLIDSQTGERIKIEVAPGSREQMGGTATNKRQELLLPLPFQVQ